MPYKVIGEEGAAVSLLKKVGEYKDRDGNILDIDHESKIYLVGDIVADEDLSPVVVSLYEAGDSHTRSVIVKVGDEGDQVDAAPASAPEATPAPKIVSKTGDPNVKSQSIPADKRPE